MGENEVQKTLFEAVKKDDKKEEASPLVSPTHISESVAPIPASPVSDVPSSIPNAEHLIPNAQSPTPAPQRLLTKAGQKKLFEELTACKSAVAQLRNQLISLNDKKRAAFLKKDIVSKKIRALIDEIKSARGERDKLTTLVKESKMRRSGLNDEIRVKVEEIKKLNKEKNELIQKHHLSADPSRLKKEIEELEYKIETEAPSPSEEKKMMQIIREKKKLYEEAKSVSSIFEKISALSKEIEKFRHKCDETHRKIQSRAATSQERHQEMLETVKGLDELRTKEKEAGEKYGVIKREFDSVNGQLQTKLMELGQLQAQIGAIKKEVFHERKKKEHATLSQKKREIEQKLRQKKKLTTEDIIAMQG